MIDVNELRKGVTFTMDGNLFRVLEYQHHKPGRGKATIRTTLRNVRTGATVQHNFTSSDRVEDIRIDRRGVQYLYTDGNLYHFMDTETYDQVALPASALGDGASYLKEGLQLVLSSYEGEALDVELVLGNHAAVRGPRHGGQQHGESRIAPEHLDNQEPLMGACRGPEPVGHLNGPGHAGAESCSSPCPAHHCPWSSEWP